MIKVINVNKYFDDIRALNDISINFETGKTNLIIGKSGSGKTVLLKSVIGLHEIDSGNIMYDDKDFTNLNSKEKKNLRKEIGMVFQGGALFDSLTVEENVMFPLNMFTNQSLEEKKERVNFCLSRVNIQNSNNKFPSEISGGMQKRVAIARAIVLNPKYLFCDEPNSGLDPVTALVIDNLIHEITEEYNITTVINTHDMNSVMEIGDNIMFIEQGIKQWVGDKTEILKTDNKVLNDFVFASKFMQKAFNK
ncbi:MAG: ATP-binding cassette domain-containing protein [Marinifilaceae bacterium]|jgi:phospholipid/cholesterol/gamma-HCH transport system ATP-binding protein|nr:ATP-binding cassette domain-containing protein [Marinifilaceae bacterium]